MQKTLREKIYESKRFAGQVQRYHAWPTLQRQTTGDHSWRVATLYCEIFGLPRAEVLYFCLHHDSGELFAGDLPFGAKSRVSGMREAQAEAETMGLQRLGVVLPELDSVETVKVKICDLLEMWEFGRVEMSMGNRFAEPVVDDTVSAAQSLAKKIFETDRVTKFLDSSLKGAMGT